jgi:hypothetical protein
MADDPIPPIAPVELDATAPAAPSAPRSSAETMRGVVTGNEEDLAANVERAELEHPVQAPSGVDTRAMVHDAALHGNPIAAAIERSERAQQLGGAAASAASGQATERSVDAVDVGGDEQDATDPLAPLTRIDDDPHRPDPRSQEERDRDADVRS